MLHVASKLLLYAMSKRFILFCLHSVLRYLARYLLQELLLIPTAVSGKKYYGLRCLPDVIFWLRKDSIWLVYMFSLTLTSIAAFSKVLLPVTSPSFQLSDLMQKTSEIVLEKISKIFKFCVMGVIGVEKYTTLCSINIASSKKWISWTFPVAQLIKLLLSFVDSWKLFCSYPYR